MRIFLVLDEISFYHPNFLARLFEQTKEEIVGVGLVRKVPKKSNIGLYLATHFYYLRIHEIFKLLQKRCVYFLKDHFGKKEFGGDFYSTQSVLDFFKLNNINYFDYSINKKEYLAIIRRTNPDVIISSTALIFGREILQVPKICCINIHSALLPAYGGIWPVLQAYRNQEKYIGVSVHIMEIKIDKGAVLSQQTVKIEKDDTLATMYEKCFEISAEMMLLALEKISKSDLSPVINEYVSSYYSFPTKEHWLEFRARGGRFI